MEWATNERDKRAHAGQVIKRRVCADCPNPPWGFSRADIQGGHGAEIENNWGLFLVDSIQYYFLSLFFTVFGLNLKLLNFWGFP